MIFVIFFPLLLSHGVCAGERAAEDTLGGENRDPTKTLQHPVTPRAAGATCLWGFLTCWAGMATPGSGI